MIGIAPCRSPRSSHRDCSTVRKLTLLSSTFLKRKGGLFKKAYELGVLCSVDVAVVIIGNNKKLYEFSSRDMREIMGRHSYVCLSSPFRHAQFADETSTLLHMNTKVRRILLAKEEETRMMTRMESLAPLRGKQSRRQTQLAAYNTICTDSRT